MTINESGAYEHLGKLLGEELSSAIIRTDSLFDARPDSVTIAGCQVKIEYIYAESCEIREKLAMKVVEFRLNEVSDIRLIEGAGSTHLSFVYRSGVAEFANDANAMIRAIRQSSSSYYVDDIDITREVTSQLELFYSQTSVDLRSTVTYCNGASVPSFFPTTDAHLFVDWTKARSLSERLNEYKDTFCPVDVEG